MSFLLLFQFGCVQKLTKCPGDVFSTNIFNELVTTDDECTSDKEKEKEKNLLYALVLAAAANSSSSSSLCDLSTEESDFHTLVNEHRVSVGCSSFTLHCGLTTVARTHSQDMANNNYFSHTSQDGTTFSQRITNAGITYSSAGENIAAGNSGAQNTLTQWLNSSGHKANIENCAYTHHGIGRAYSSSSTYGYYWTNVFAQDPSGN
ncbi:MAG: CAP domain-containing protein [Leptospiraceae bacterium]|nr:CAP domain-containing protein [Leptospiraceae bacterium]